MDSILINSPRVGNGYDVHALKEGLPMRLCGVDIPSDKGFVAHSDGDVAIHAQYEKTGRDGCFSTLFFAKMWVFKTLWLKLG